MIYNILFFAQIAVSLHPNKYNPYEKSFKHHISCYARCLRFLLTEEDGREGGSHRHGPRDGDASWKALFSRKPSTSVYQAPTAR